MNVSRLLNRIKKEMEAAKNNPTSGVSFCGVELPYQYEATLLGPPDSPYEGGLFHMQITLGHDYPFSPPDITFTTRIFHPNIDEHGRICLDVLKPPPNGTWNATNNIMSVLTTIRELLVSPNPYDPLCNNIAQMYLTDKETFVKVAREYTQKYAQEAKPPFFLQCCPPAGTDSFIQPSTLSNGAGHNASEVPDEQPSSLSNRAGNNASEVPEEHTSSLSNRAGNNASEEIEEHTSSLSNRAGNNASEVIEEHTSSSSTMESEEDENKNAVGPSSSPFKRQMERQQNLGEARGEEELGSQDTGEREV